MQTLSQNKIFTSLFINIFNLRLCYNNILVNPVQQIYFTSVAHRDENIIFLVGRVMETKLYVGNLSYSTTEDDLRTLFAQAGTVKSVTLIKDRDSGRSKGFAFVEMETQAEVEKAIAQFNGILFNERSISVNIARPREEFSRKPFRDSRGGRDRQGGNRSRGGDKGGRRRPW